MLYKTLVLRHIFCECRISKGFSIYLFVLWYSFYIHYRKTNPELIWKPQVIYTTKGPIPYNLNPLHQAILICMTFYFFSMAKMSKIKWRLLRRINTFPDRVAIKMCGKNNLYTSLSLASPRRKSYQRPQSLLWGISLEQLCVMLLLLSHTLIYNTEVFSKYFYSEVFIFQHLFLSEKIWKCSEGRLWTSPDSCHFRILYVSVSHKVCMTLMLTSFCLSVLFLWQNIESKLTFFFKQALFP